MTHVGINIGLRNQLLTRGKGCRPRRGARSCSSCRDLRSHRNLQAVDLIGDPVGDAAQETGYVLVQLAVLLAQRRDGDYYSRLNVS
jgi:hypothetical protein